MAETNEFYDLTCAFCGEKYHYSKDDLYEKSDEKGETFQKKICTVCQQPLTTFCPSCKGGIRLDLSFNNLEFEVLKSFWEPKISRIDALLPELEKKITSYSEHAQKLTPISFRASQKDFLKEIPKIREELEELILFLKEGESIKRISTNFSKLLKKIYDQIQNSIDECIDIQANMEISSHTVNEKKEKKLKKSVPFMDFVKDFKELNNQIKLMRNSEKESEINALKPGFEKVKKNIKQNPEFFLLQCPICMTKLYFINYQIYMFQNDGENLQFVSNLPAYFIKKEKQNQDSGTKTIRFSILIHIEKATIEDYKGFLALVLTEGEPENIGRNLIREANYENPDIINILSGEANLLRAISRKQFSLSKKEDRIILIGQEYDEQRLGTFLNSMDNDIRENGPEGIEIKKGDKIILPLTYESGNPNRIELILN